MSSTNQTNQNNHKFSLSPGRWVLENIVSAAFGFTKDQLQKYRAKGLMLEGVHYRKNPANRIVYCIDAINDWQEGKI